MTTQLMLGMLLRHGVLNDAICQCCTPYLESVVVRSNACSMRNSRQVGYIMDCLGDVAGVFLFF